jgi:membrane-associated phospholipid phosphatase
MRLGLAILVVSSLAYGQPPPPWPPPSPPPLAPPSLPPSPPPLAPPSLPPSPPRVDRPYQLRLDIDITLLLGGTVLWGGTIFVGAGATPPPWCGTMTTPACDPKGLNALDRTAAGLFNPKASLAADILTGVVPGALIALDIVDAGVVRNWRGWLEDGVVIAQAVAWDGAIQDIVRRAVRRPRPFMYTPGLNAGEREGPEATFSFYSGHTSGTFAIATATAYTYSLRHPRSKWQYLVWTLALAAASSEPILRVVAGGHFPTDCIVGALMGSASGMLFPALHRKRVPIRLVSSATAEQATVSVAGKF